MAIFFRFFEGGSEHQTDKIRLFTDNGLHYFFPTDIIKNKQNNGGDFMSTYYISSSLGNDLNNGLSENTAWKTLENISKISGGDTVKLKCGDTFFGSIAVPDCNTTQCQTCITSYGDGEKPIISFYKTALFWQAHTENIWKLDLTDKNSFSGNPSLNTNVGFIFAENEIKPCKKFEMSQLENNWDFYNDDRFVYLYLSEKPSDNIQLACDGTAITLGDNCRVENLEICGCILRCSFSITSQGWL